jgi:hypothetical protein
MIFEFEKKNNIQKDYKRGAALHPSNRFPIPSKSGKFEDAEVRFRRPRKGR